MTKQVDGQREAALLSAARRLLQHQVNLDAVQVLHAEVARSLNPASTSLPARYGSVAEARAQHARLQALLGAHTAAGAGNPLGRLLEKQPWWIARAAAATLLVVLTLRYAWAVTYNKNWARQNPEGNWISRYYAGAEFKGNPMLRYDVGINVDFGTGGPIARESKDNFSVRWDTCLVVAREVAVPLTLQADDWAQLLVDGRAQIQIDPGPGVTRAEVLLKPGIRHVRVDFVERQGAALVRLEGFDGDATGAYTFQRPRISGRELTCAESEE